LSHLIELEGQSRTHRGSHHHVVEKTHLMTSHWIADWFHYYLTHNILWSCYRL
jgi:hypothetical protein